MRIWLLRDTSGSTRKTHSCKAPAPFLEPPKVEKAYGITLTHSTFQCYASHASCSIWRGILKVRLPIEQTSELESVDLSMASESWLNQLQTSSVFLWYQTQLSLVHTRKYITYRKSLNAPLSSQTCLPLLEIK